MHIPLLQNQEQDKPFSNNHKRNIPSLSDSKTINNYIAGNKYLSKLKKNCSFELDQPKNGPYFYIMQARSTSSATIKSLQYI